MPNKWGGASGGVLITEGGCKIESYVFIVNVKKQIYTNKTKYQL